MTWGGLLPLRLTRRGTNRPVGIEPKEDSGSICLHDLKAPGERELETFRS